MHASHSRDMGRQLKWQCKQRIMWFSPFSYKADKTGNTTNLMSHLKSNHLMVYMTLNRTKKHAITYYLAKDSVLFNAVDHPGFQQIEFFAFVFFTHTDTSTVCLPCTITKRQVIAINIDIADIINIFFSILIFNIYFFNIASAYWRDQLQQLYSLEFQVFENQYGATPRWSPIQL